MEKQLSTLRDEFTRCTRRSERQHLVLSDLLTFSHSLPVRDLSHIAVVWCLDRTHSGRISMADLLALGEALLTRSRQFQSFEREAQLQAVCTMKLWRDVSSNPDAFVTWITNLVLECSSERKTFQRHGHEVFVSLDTVQTLHSALRLQQQHGLGLQEFVDLLHRAGEERGLMDLQDESQDDWLPLATIQDFASGLYAGAARLMSDVLGGTELSALAAEPSPAASLVRP